MLRAMMMMIMINYQSFAKLAPTFQNKSAPNLARFEARHLVRGFIRFCLTAASCPKIFCSLQLQFCFWPSGLWT